MYNQFLSPYHAQIQSRQQIIRVNGENGARAYQMAPGSSILLLDETSPIVWLKQTDDAGYPTLTAYKIEPYIPEVQQDFNALSERISRLEKMINESDNTDVK